MKILFFGIVMLSSFFANAQCELHVHVNNLKKNKGKVVVALFNKEGDFLKKDYKNKVVNINGDLEAVAVFKNLPQGTYAVSVIHDENENKELDANFVGIPKEAFGFSRDAKGGFGPPSFDAASFSLVTGRKEISIRLTHLL